MGVGFSLTGTYPPDPAEAAEDWLDRAAAWLEGHEEEPLMVCRRGVNDADQPTLYVHVHPAAEELELTVPDEGRVAAAAKTSTVGPGYHIFLCDLLHQLGRHAHVTWEKPGEDDEGGDETGYFFSRDPAAVRDEMLRWLAALARVVTDDKFAEESQVRMVSMPLGYSYPDQQGVLTPLGPRSLEWFKAVGDDPSLGADFFPWWPAGSGAPFYLGRALCRMWQDVRWRTPVTEAEGELLMDVHLDLERAFTLDPDAAIPWAEWREIVEYLDEYFGYVEFQEGEDLAELIAERTARQPAPAFRIGYRRGPVQVSLTGGWLITIPGEFAEEWETNGQTWSAWLGGRTVWFTSWSVAPQDEADEPRSPDDLLDGLELPAEGDVIEIREGGLVGRGVFAPYEEDGQQLWNLKAYSVVEGGFALCNVFVPARDDLDWALDVWKGLRH